VICDCGHLISQHQTGEGVWTGFCYADASTDTDPTAQCKCENPTTEHLHQQHVVDKGWDFTYCPICRDILRCARNNHDEHAGYYSPLPDDVPCIQVRPGKWVVTHTDIECVEAYVFYARKMSES